MADLVSIQKLRDTIDELATALLVSGATAELVDGFAALYTAAAACGADDIAQIAMDILRQFSDSSIRDESLHQSLLQIQEHLQTCVQASSSRDVTSPPVNALAQDPELVGDFVNESREHLVSIESGLLVLDQNAEELEAIHAVFRGFHTIKGLAGFLEFTPVRDLAHEVETLLDLARNSKLRISPSIVDAILESVDYLKQSMDSIERTVHGKAADAFPDNSGLIARIHNFIAQPAEDVEDAADDLASLAEMISAPAAYSEPAVSIPGPAAEQIAAAEQSPPPVAPPKSAPASSRKAQSQEASSVRVLTSKLDHLMDMVGEMVITQSLIRHNPALNSLQNAKLLTDLAQLARITGEVQRTTMAMRMITVGHVFQRSTRLIRDLARKAGKQVQIDISGEDTELDKTIAEELTDPLLHMVRNACDHGIEDPAERVATEKDPVARVRLAAYHQGGQIVIEIGDDGRGLDPEKILAKAIQKGLVQPSAQLNEQEIFNLIFEPGFSTAAQITDISGRGVGMDVVRKNIQKLRGRIEIQSTLGRGATFFLKLPLTLAIIEGLVVGVGVHRYIVPIHAVRELISPKPGAIKTVHGCNETAVVRGRLLPVMRLSRRFGLTPRSEDATQGVLIITETQDQLFALLVDEVAGKQEVVIKSLGESLKTVPGIAAAAILGDGRVGLILDLDGVFRG